MNSYYVITLPNNTDRTRLNTVLALGKNSNLPVEKLHYRISLDGTKVLVQGDIPSSLQTFIQGKAYIEYLGDYVNGQPEAKVIQWLQDHASEWQENI